MNFLIGSRAWNYWQNPSEFRNTERDWDIVTDDPDSLPDFLEGCRVDVSRIDELYNKEIFIDTYKVRSLQKVDDIWLSIAYPAELAIIKRSHLHRPCCFHKHISQYHGWKLNDFTMKEIVEDNLSPHMQHMLRERTRLTKEKFGDKTPVLNMSNKEFFDDNVQKYFDHDDIHRLMAHRELPAYEYMKSLEKFDQAWCEKDKWNDFEHLHKIQCVMEEAYVIALERWLIPHFLGMKTIEKPIVPRMCFMLALEKICTTLCGGFFRDFAIDNWQEIHKSFNKEHMMSFFEKSLFQNYLNQKQIPEIRL